MSRWVKVLHPTQHKTDDFRDVLPSRSLGLVRKTLKLTQQKQTRARMWAYAQCDGHCPNIGGTLYWMLLRKSRKWCSGAIWVRKKTARLSQQLQGRHIQNLAVMVTERRSLNTFVLVFRFAVLFSNYTSSKSHHRQTVGQNRQIFAPQNVGDTDRAASDLHYIITQHSNILAKVPRGGVLWPRRLERKK